MGDIGVSDSPTTFDPSAAPHDELLMEFSSAASASNGSDTFVSTTKGPDLFALPLSSGIAVSGTIVDDPSTLTAPFLPGDAVLACLLPPKPVLLSAHEDSLRLRTQTSSALELPDDMLPETATSYLSALLLGAAVLKQELHIPILRTPTASPNPAEEHGVETYNNRRILVVGGETSLGAAMVQLLRRALPETRVLVASTLGDETELLQRRHHMVGLGANSAIDGTVDDIDDRLPPAVDIIINTAKGELVRKEIMDLLSGPKKFVDCSTLDVEATVKSFLEDEADCVTALHELLLQAASVFSTEVEPDAGTPPKDISEHKRNDSGVELI